MPEDTASSDILSVGFDTLLSVNGKLRGHPDDHAKLKCGIPEAESLDSVGMMTHFMLPENIYSFIDVELHMYHKRSKTSESRLTKVCQFRPPRAPE